MPRRIFVGLPDYEARVAVLNNMLQSVPLDASFDIDLVARNTRGYSPSDMREVLQAAALFPLREARAAAVSYDGEGMSKAVPLSIPALRALRTEDVLKALEGAKPTHFSKTYERDLMEYVRRSGGAEDSHYGDQSPTVSDADGSQFIADAGAYFGNQEERDSDEYSYDDESESDDFL
jgi:SpoVK/Ycf46/Vps4 family AAA+-type ATPase